MVKKLIVVNKMTNLVGLNGYERNFRSKGMSGSILQYFTLHTKSDLQKKKTMINKRENKKVGKRL